MNFRAEIERLSSLVTRALSLASGFAFSKQQTATWRAQSVWYVDFDNGSDLADGKTLATALLTVGELVRRVGQDFTPAQNDVDIYCYGHNKPTDPLSIDGWNTSVPRGPISPYPGPENYALKQIRFHQMTPRAYYTGAITAIQAADWQAANGGLPYVITDTNAKGSNQTPAIPPPNNNTYWYNPTLDWFGVPRAGNHDQQRVRIIAGPRTGAVAWTATGILGAFNLFGGGGNGAIRVSNFAIPVPFGYTANYATIGVTPVTPIVGDVYAVEELGKMYLDRLVIRGNGDFGGSGVAFNGFDFYLVNGGDSQNPSNQPPIINDGGSIAFINCNFNFNAVVTSRAQFGGSYIYFLNCSGIDGIAATGAGFTYVDAGQYHLQLAASDGAILIPDADAFITTGAIYAYRCGQIWLSSCQVWDVPGHFRKAGVMVQDFGTVLFGYPGFYGYKRIWGNDQTGNGVVYTPGRAYGMAAIDNGRILFAFESDPNLANYVKIHGWVTDFGIGLSWQNGNTAVSIDPATKLPTTMRACTYDNFFNKTLAQNGFNKRIVDPETGAIIAGLTSQTAPTA